MGKVGEIEEEPIENEMFPGSFTAVLLHFIVYACMLFVCPGRAIYFV